MIAWKKKKTAKLCLLNPKSLELRSVKSRVYCICMYVYMSEHAPCLYFDTFTDLLISGIVYIHLGQCLVNLNISPVKIGAIQLDFKTENGCFLKSSYSAFY
jgi:hypothetical protein